VEKIEMLPHTLIISAHKQGVKEEKTENW